MANTLIDDGYFEEVFLLTPSQAEQMLRKNQTHQQGMGLNTEKSRFIKYGEKQQEYEGQDDNPVEESNPLLTRLKTWEGIGADDVISRYHRYNQLGRLTKDYFKKGILLPKDYTIESIIKERRDIFQKLWKSFRHLRVRTNKYRCSKTTKKRTNTSRNTTE